MVLISALVTKVNKLLGPNLLRHGLTARHSLLTKFPSQQPRSGILDTMFGITLAQHILSSELRHDLKLLQQRKERDQENTSWMKQVKGKVDDAAEEVWSTYLEKLHQSYTGSTASLQAEQRAKETLSKTPRIALLETYIRKAILPNEVWNDVDRWRFHPFFVKWIRTEFLWAKYGGHYNDDQTSKMKTLMQTQKRLPSRNIIIKKFDMQDWSHTKNITLGWDTMEDIASSLPDGEVFTIHDSSVVKIADLPPNTSVAHLSLEQILELAGAHVMYSGSFNMYCEEYNLYEMWNVEYVDGLALYLWDRIEEFSNAEEGEEEDVIIMDVGAGDGALMYHLQDRMKVEMDRRRTGRQILQKQQKAVGKKSKNNGKKTSKTKRELKMPDMIATDDGSWNIRPFGSVEMLDVSSSMTKYSKGKTVGGGKTKKKHMIVLCSWMPMGEDWTNLFRQSSSSSSNENDENECVVQEYILIGECDDGTCGHNWFTWGNPNFLDDDDDNDQDNDDEAKNMITDHNDEHTENPLPLLPPYEVDGYKRVDLEELSKLQFSRYDTKVSSSSKTVSFRRNIAT